VSDDEPEVTEDELWADLGEATGSDKAEILLELAARSGAAGDYEKTMSLAETALETAREASNDFLTGQAHLMMGRTFYAQENYEQSAASHVEGVHALRNLGDSSDTARACLLAAESFSEAGMYDKALEYADNARLGLSEGEDYETLAEAWTTRADILRKQGEWRLVIDALWEARGALRTVQMVGQVLECDVKLADSYAEIGEFADAVMLLGDTVNVAETFENGRSAHFYYYKLGQMMRLAGDIPGAMSYLEKSLEQNLRESNIAGIASLYVELARCHAAQEELEKAIEYITKARAHYDVLGRGDAVVDCEVSHSIWLHGLGRYDEAARTNQRIAEFGEGLAAYWARSRRADNLFFLDQYDEALEALAVNDDQRAREESEGVPTRAQAWRDSIRAKTLVALERPDEAFALARDVMTLPDFEEFDSSIRALMYEIRGKGTRETEPEQSRADLAHAVALYLAAGFIPSAQRLSEEFLPAVGSGANDDTN